MKTLLLGHLAQFAAFSEQSELLCTRGLAYLLQNSQAKSGFAAWIGRRVGTKLKKHLTWIAENTQKRDGGRPDLEARVNGKPVVKIEAKLGAPIDRDQLRSYATDLKAGGSDIAILLVLVPRKRVDQAKQAVSAIFKHSDCCNVSVAVITWKEVLAVLAKYGDQHFRSELEQFRAMYDVLADEDIKPVAGPEECRRLWHDQKEMFVKLFAKVCRQLAPNNKMPPLEKEQVSEGHEMLSYDHRYFSRPFGDEKTYPCFSIGLRDPFDECPTTPIWLRFHKDTYHFDEVGRRLRSSGFNKKGKMVVSGGHIWIPLRVPFNAEADQMENALLKQIEEIIRIVY